MILAVDIGNSNMSLGVYQKKELIHYWRLTTLRAATTDDLGVKMRTLLQSNSVSLDDIDAVVYCSVVPPLDDAFNKMCKRYIGASPLQVKPGVRTGINITYDHPREVGADRIANAVAASAQWSGPIVVVDFGTATTLDVLSAEGDYAGGVILPGVGISTEALFDRAARLPRIDLSRPGRAVGKNTVDSMRSGIVYGNAGAVDSLVWQIAEEVGQPNKVVATGGWARVIASECKTVDEMNLYLTLEGLRIIYTRNQMN